MRRLPRILVVSAALSALAVLVGTASAADLRGARGTGSVVGVAGTGAARAAGGARPPAGPSYRAGGPGGPIGPVGRREPDTSAVLAEARYRQRRFERFRRRRLPWTWGRGGPPCHERVGRYCLWLGDDGSDWEPTPEPAEVTRARRRLLAHLDSALTAAPGNGWLVDQRVRYLVEAGRLHAALVAARTCDAGPARCRSLAGFVRHRMGQFPEAEGAFREALAAMPPDSTCRWRDLSPLYRGPPAPGYGNGRCEARRPAEEWIWRLSDPLWLVPGNDRLTEHFARHVHDRMQAGGAASPFGDPWGTDLREILLRYGWPVGFEQAHPDVFDATAARPAVAHYPEHGMRYLPPALPEGEEYGERLREWDLDAGRPVTEHAPGYLEREMASLDRQVARFGRGDSVRVVAAWRWPPPDDGDPAGDLPRSPDLRTGLFVVAREEGVLAARRSPGAGIRRRACGRGAAAGVLSARYSVPTSTASDGDGGPPPMVVGIEAYAPSESAAARVREPLDPLPISPGGTGLSDLLLTAPARDTVPAVLAQAARCARPGTRVSPGDRLGLYWEVYPGGAGGGSVRTELSVTATGGGVIRAIGEFLGLAGERRPVVEASWTERIAPGTPVHRRSLVVRIPADAGEGDYRLALRVGPPGGQDDRTVHRTLEIRRP